MKTAKLLFFILGLLLLNTSCLLVDVIDSVDETHNQITGSGHLISLSRDLPEFNSVEMNTSGKVYITQGSEQEVSVTVDENIAEYIITTVRGGRLIISTKSGISLSNFRLIVNLTMTDLEELVTNSSGDFIGKSTFKVDRMSLVTNSSGNISLNLDADQLYSRILSSGDLYLSGVAKKHVATIHSSGNIYAFNLFTEAAKITINSSGDAEVYVSNLLEVIINSSGDVFYKGHPTLHHSINSSGRLIDAN